MRNPFRHLRLRRVADEVDDPETSTLLRRLADLSELDLKRQALPRQSPERDRLDREIVDRSHRIHGDEHGADV
jgi:hypothetical protein